MPGTEITLKWNYQLNNEEIAATVGFVRNQLPRTVRDRDLFSFSVVRGLLNPFTTAGTLIYRRGTKSENAVPLRRKPRAPHVRHYSNFIELTIRAKSNPAVHKRESIIW